MYLGANGYLFEIARDLGARETEAEKFLWSRLCSNQLGVKFRRQHPIYYYVVDFYCHSHRLVIEVDGSVHKSNEAQFDDSVRSKGFEEFDITVMRSQITTCYLLGELLQPNQITLRPQFPRY